MTLKQTLIAFNSRRDRSGNCYYAMRFIDHETGRTVEGIVSGGESNIDAVRLHWDTPGQWSRSFIRINKEMTGREFNRMTKGWEYAGCGPEDIAAFIRRKLAEPAKTE